MDHGKSGEIERKAFIFNVQKYNMYDGPGIRTLVFFKGCPLRCKWCSNPEGLERKFQVMYKQSFCTNCGACADVCPVGIHVMSNGTHEIVREKECIGCMKCKNICPKSALTIAGEVKTISELLKIVEEDAAFYDMSGGGVTLGGGEVTAQPEAALNLLMACKQEGINTAIETCGYSNTENILKIAEYVDLFLFDIKHMDPVRHNELTGVNNEQILTNLEELLHRRYNVKVRMPMLKGINDSREEIDAVIKFLMPYRTDKNFKGIDLLPYHKLGVNKYNQLDKVYPIDGDPSLSAEDLDRIEGWMKEYDFPVNVVKH
ncbi:choline TMA-lyase-activating enzyme [Lachnoclostridium phytofermentans]|uniref:Choline trimethylamine-lyase activating enzyme n=1 Tax=Lachnoclostridium phytofermentans (strain ATCC 700394 / DSM 18823 / ISDg) TaxID=357809 RepID=A9KPD1_LACP7|nr:choline TMA-lyase-activating enzyme [Lachnoclostridium phytofermentans]ABX41793.1 glycyl-radical enzyme activating protein family [Lachnoclostridium phytofermentans ISDg]